MLERDLAHFGDFELDLETGELWKDRRPVPLRPLASRALVALVENAGRAVAREELRGILWPDSFVAWDPSLNQCIRQVRRALGDDPEARVFVETLPRYGYRFKGPVIRQRVAFARQLAPANRYIARMSVAFVAGVAIPVILLAICAVLAGG